MRLSIIAVLAAGVVLARANQAAAEPNATGQAPLALDLRSSVRAAVNSSPVIRSAGAAADMTGAGVARAESALRPSLGVQSGYSYLSEETIFGATPVWEHSTLVNRMELQQMLYSGGKVEANIRQARHGFAASGHGYRAARAAVVAEVATAYFRARQASEVINVARSSVRALEASHSAAKKLHEAGLATRTDVLRAEVALSGARASLISAQNGYDVALAALRAAIGLPAATPITLASGAADRVPDFAAAPASERPEVSAAAASVLAAEQGIRAAKAGRLPTVALAADYYHEPQGAGFPRMSDTILAGVVVKLNILDGGLTRASVSEADAAKRKAIEDLEARLRAVEVEQQTAKLNMDSAKARLEATSTRVAAAEESLRALQVGYSEGMTPLTDVLSGEAALTSARADSIASQYDVRIAEVSYLRAHGQTDALTR